MKNDGITTFLAFALAIFICVPAMAFIQYGDVPQNGGLVTPANPLVRPSQATRDHLGATDGFIKMPDGRDVYTFGFVNISSAVKFRNQSTVTAIQGKHNAEFPAPTIDMREGKHHYLSLSTLGMAMRPDLFDPHTVHFHGYPHASSIYDGEPMSSLKVNQGADFTYFYQLNDPGTYMYHCHNEATEHMEMGMLGNLLVRPRQDEFLQSKGLTISYNGRAYNKFVYNDCDNLPPNASDPLPGGGLTGTACGSTGFDHDYPIKFADIDPAFHDADSFAQALCFACFKATYFTLNGRGYPDTVNPNPLMNNAADYLPPASLPPADPTLANHPAQKIDARVIINKTAGERAAVLRLINLSIQEFVTVEIPNLPVQVIGKDAKFLRRPNGKDLRYYANSILVGPGESAELRIDVFDPTYPVPGGVPTGTYYMYSRMYDQLTADQMDRSGAMTEIQIQ
jgi:FtsP/CotA-like multicopper oxidase with cupredoxin domain